mgnify:CR=1 FL=1
MIKQDEIKVPIQLVGSIRNLLQSVVDVERSTLSHYRDEDGVSDLFDVELMEHKVKMLNYYLYTDENVLRHHLETEEDYKHMRETLIK